MSNKSGVSSQVITLPTGGGALQGMGETFAPDLFTGTGNFTVPIAIPDGRNGFAPELNLVYSTATGNGPFGLGWELSVPRVSRKTSRGVPRYREDTDTFLLSGHEDLVPVGAGRFRPRTEGLFARIEHLTQGGDHWQVRGKDGLLSRFACQVADPARPTRIFAWNLTETVDPFGNSISYGYQAHSGQQYLEVIRYVDLDGGRFAVSVTFVYEDRPDPFSDRRAGFEIRTGKRCRRVEVRTHPGGEDLLVRTYHLDYQAELPRNGVSLLSRVRIEGHVGDASEELPPLTFGYSGFEPEAARLSTIEGTGPTFPRRSLSNADFELVDLHGTGLPDIVQLNGVAQFWRNLGHGRFDVPRPMPEVPSGVRLDDAGTQLGDMNGNGRADLLVLSQGGYFPLSFTGRWSPQGFVRYPAVPSVPFGDGNLRLVDLDGDGVVDALRTGTSFELFFNNPVRGWDRVQTVPRRPLPEFPDVSFASPAVKLGDLSGDGLQDIVLVQQGQIHYWPYLGHGEWDRRITMANSPVFRDSSLPAGQFDPSRVVLGDVDGDGLDDIVYFGPDRVTVWINQCGNGWGEPVVLPGTPAFPDADAVRVTDMLGTGTAGLLWTRDTPGSTPATYRFADLTSGVKPYLLTEIDNHRGARTVVRYSPSIDFYLADAAQPESRWKTPLPFGVQVVSAVEVTDEVSAGRFTTEYRYHHGYWDGAEREFRGFGMVEQLDTEIVDHQQFSPPVLTRTWFHLGPIGDEFRPREEADFSAEYWPGDPSILPRPDLPSDAGALRSLRGLVLRTEIFARDGSDRQDRPFTVTEAQYGVRVEHAGVYFAHPVASRSSQWERGDDPMHRFTFSSGYDVYGLAGTQIGLAVPRGRDFSLAATASEPYLGTRTLTTFAQRDDEQHYIVDRVASTSTHEIVNDGRLPLWDLVQAVTSGTAALSVVGQSFTYYDGADFTGLSLHQLGEHGAPMRCSTLVITDAQLHQAWPDLPPYLRPDSDPQWTDEYPQAFREQLPPLAGYTHSAQAGGYFINSTRSRLDSRGLTVATRDPLGRETAITYDELALLPVKVVQPTGLTSEAVYDPGTLQPRLVTDECGNRTAFAFTPAGLLSSIAVMGKDGEQVGDTEALPGTQIRYDFVNKPFSARTIRRVQHGQAAAQTLETLDYSDGFGRVVQSRSHAEEALFEGLSGVANDDAAHPNVAVSGWQVFDNKGRVVERYEPFHTAGWEYAPPTTAQLGRKASTYYDPRGQVVRTVQADGCEQRICYGVPETLDDPDRFSPTPWEAYIYDSNDNAGRTHSGAAQSYRHHWDTPSSVLLDALGRTISGIERHRSTPTAPIEQIRTRSVLDSDGRPLTTFDAQGRPAMRYVYDLTGAAIRIDSLDAGTRRQVFNATGGVIERRDAKSALVLQAFDGLGRRSLLWARDSADGPVTLRERTEFGGTDAASRAANRTGRLHRHFDEAGAVTVESYDFKGNILEQTRQVISDETILAAFPATFQADWAAQPAPRLDPAVYRTSYTYDALDRVATMHYPADVTGHRHRLEPAYSRAGLLEQLRLDGQIYLERLAYNAKGQRLFAALGNGVLTRYEYDPATARLTRLVSQRYTKPGELTYHTSGAALQDLAYEHDLVGNVLAIIDRAPGSGVAANPLAGQVSDPQLRRLVAQGDALIRRFTYDPLYRLVSADGRECAAEPTQPWEDMPCPDDGNAPHLTALYQQTYTYDRLGNLTRLRHRGADGVQVRQFALAVGTNRLHRLTVGQASFDYTVDACGNQTGETGSRHFGWDHSDRLTSFLVQAGDSEASIHAQYLYDGAGQRVKKLVRTQGGGVESAVYIDDTFEHRRWQQGTTLGENNQVHVMAGILLRIGAAHPQDQGPATQYHLADAIGSSALVVSQDGAFVSREEFTPFGETSLGSFARKRFRFTGMERDAESGLSYHGARYYAPWLARWISCDPAGPVDGPNLYRYSRNNPMTLADPGGTQPEDKDTLMRRGPFESSIPPPDFQGPADDGLDFDESVSVEDVVIPAPIEDPEEEDSGFWTSFWGGVKIVGGIALAVGGCAITAGVGCVAAAAVGAGQVSAGIHQLATADEYRNPIEQGASDTLQLAGVPEETADLITMSAEAGYSLAVGVTSMQAPKPPVTELTSEDWQVIHRLMLIDDEMAMARAEGRLIFDWELPTVERIAPRVDSSYRGYGRQQADIKKMIENGRERGAPSDAQIGHIDSHVTAKPGERIRLRLEDRVRNNKMSKVEKERAKVFRQKSKELGLDPHKPGNPYFTRPPAKKR